MTKLLSFSLLASLMAAASAQTPAPPAGGAAPPPPPPRARGPALDVAIEAAKVAQATCLANGYKTTVTVVDSAGVPVVILSGDGASERTQAIGLSKTWATIKYKAPSGDIADRVKTDAALDAEVKADPKIGTVRRGALPLVVGNEIIGAISVSGAPGGDKDEVCVQAGIDKVKSQLK
ncbi:MAG: heme-binding protein [Steroidobacteraceae bacterium]